MVLAIGSPKQRGLRLPTLRTITSTGGKVISIFIIRYRVRAVGRYWAER